MREYVHWVKIKSEKLSICLCRPKTISKAQEVKMGCHGPCIRALGFSFQDFTCTMFFLKIL